MLQPVLRVVKKRMQSTTYSIRNAQFAGNLKRNLVLLIFSVLILRIVLKLKVLCSVLKNAELRSYNISLGLDGK